jgi:hypothetical protein
MNLRLLNSLKLSMLAVLSSTLALSQMTVDATGPVRERQRNAMAGHGGSIGRNLPLRVTIEIQGPSPNSAGKSVVEFTITNLGKTDLTIPISPNPGDLEPSDPKASYTGMFLGLRVTSGRAPGTILSGGADLYGSHSFPGTLITLTPSESIQVLALVTFPPVSPPESNADVFVADATLNSETIKMVNGQPLLDMQNIGSARSQKYTSQSLFKSSE